MLEGGQWNEVVHPPGPALSTWAGNQTDSHFPDGDTEAPSCCKGGQVPTSVFFFLSFFFRDKDPISGVQGIGKGGPEDKGLVIASKPLCPCIGRAGPVVLSRPQSPNSATEGSGPEARRRLGGGKVSLILPPSAIIASPPTPQSFHRYL